MAKCKTCHCQHGPGESHGNVWGKDRLRQLRRDIDRGIFVRGEIRDLIARADAWMTVREDKVKNPMKHEIKVDRSNGLAGGWAQNPAPQPYITPTLTWTSNKTGKVPAGMTICEFFDAVKKHEKEINEETLKLMRE